MPRNALQTSTVFLTLLLSSCGSLSSPISIATTQPSQPDPRPDFTLEPVEGQPRGLMLRLRADIALSPEGTIVVERRIGDGKVERIRTIELSEKRIDKIAAGKLKFLDRSVVADARHHYRLSYRTPASEGADEPVTERTSPPVTVTWQTPPPRPDRIEARQVDQTVELHWQPSGRGAVLFRRDVLADESRVRRLTTVGPGARGHFVDRSVRPDGVYAYQIALAAPESPFPQFGPPSEPLYISLSDDK